MAERRRSGRSGSGGGGKDDGPPKTRSCGTMVVHERLLRTDPSYMAARNDSENRAFTYARRPDFLVGRSGVTVIPTVVHVVYNGAAQNISDGQIQSQIDVLNHDFRKTNATSATCRRSSSRWRRTRGSSSSWRRPTRAATRRT